MMATGNVLQFRRANLRSDEKVRHLNANELGIAPPLEDFSTDLTPESEDSEETEVDETVSEPVLDSAIDATDPYYQQVISLLTDGYAGVIFAGPPGTSKTYYAHHIAILLADGDPARIRSLQFHASYQYEDFVEGYVPRRDGSGFRLREKHLLEMCKVAKQQAGKRCVIVIDELSRADPGRVFGESLTYVEMSRRGQEFKLASGRTVSIPANLVFLATMNVFDRGVDEIDIAFERRFARIAMDPDVTALRNILTTNQMLPVLQDRLTNFFQFLQRLPLQYCHVGHAYFRLARSREDLERLWDHQLRFTLEKACRLEQDVFNRIKAAWGEVVAPLPEPTTTEVAVDGDDSTT